MGAEAETAPAPPQPVVVAVVLSLAPRRVREETLRLSAGATLADVQAVCLGWMDAPAHTTSLEWSVWGRPALESQALQTGDRVEATRPLRVDPKVARRERFARQGARAAGLFAKRQRRLQGPPSAESGKVP